MKKLILIFIVVIVGIYIGYRYIYHDHRNIADEKAAFSLEVKQIIKEFETNENEANKKYLDKSVVINGIISNVDIASKSIVLEEKVLVILNETISCKVNQKVTIQGRLIGYDSLLGELKIDQSTIKK